MKTMRIQFSLLLLLFVCCIGAGTQAQKAANVRPPAVAGQFYPSDPAHLKLAVQQFLEDAVPATVEKPVALVVPHAGYIYAGQIIADAFRQVKGQSYDTVVILGTNHGRNAASQSMSGVSVYARGAYRTPLGDALVDEAIASALLAEDRDCSADTAPQAAEHSIEVQVPFVQTLFPSARIVPVMIGMPDPPMCARLGKAIAKVAKDKRVLIVASSDLSHYPNYKDATNVDRQTLEAIASLDPSQFGSRVGSLMSYGTPNLETCACGEGPILAAMSAAKALGATHGVVVSHANSGDVVAEDRSRVVGYGAVVFAAGEGAADTRALNPPAAPLPAGPLQSADKRTLLKFARQSLQRFLLTETVPLARNLSPRLQLAQGVFVTLKDRGELRGCIGHLIDDFPVGLATVWMSVQAGENDPRFPPVTLKELAGLEIEISVMTPLKPISKPTDIVVGRDGVVIRKAGLSAVFLPQVATEQHWGLGEMLDNLCLKAGLPREAWKSGAQFQVFQADVFSESQYR
jgi:AmmeMemoRadiSam system protein B/AmmeMemoRadiSam system protein A